MSTNLQTIATTTTIRLETMQEIIEEVNNDNLSLPQWIGQWSLEQILAGDYEDEEEVLEAIFMVLDEIDWKECTEWPDTNHESININYEELA